MTSRVRSDSSSHAYWEARSGDYIRSLQGPYHEHRLNVVRALIANVKLQEMRCLDVGCGEGIFAEYLLHRRASVLGFDSSEFMVERAKSRLEGFGGSVDLVVGGISCMVDIEPASVDAVFALNVLAYLTSEEERCFYENSARILRPDGMLVATHSNELFDVFTFNRFTADFFRRHFSVDDVECDVKSLLRRPTEPERHTFSVRENPLAYRYKLASYGFSEIAQEFANFHPLPPLLMPQRDPDDINAHEYRDTIGWPESTRWKLMFMCSMFASRAIRKESLEGSSYDGSAIGSQK